MTILSNLKIDQVENIHSVENLHSVNKFAIASDTKGAIIIKVKKGNRIILTNISYGQRGQVNSVVNINKIALALCTANGIGIYNKKY